MRTLEDLGPAKLHDAERSRIRDAVDTLLFADALDPAAFEAVADMENLAATLTQSGRWLAETAVQLAVDVAACGPSPAGMPTVSSGAVSVA